MPRKQSPLVPIEKRRGVPMGDMIWNDWEMILLRADRDRPRADEPDVVIDRLVKAGLVGAAQRDVGRELAAGTLKPPAGKWALLIQLQGQPWLYLAPSWRDYTLAASLAGDAGLTTLLIGHQDTAGVTFVQLHQGKDACRSKTPKNAARNSPTPSSRVTATRRTGGSSSMARPRPRTPSCASWTPTSR